MSTPAVTRDWDAVWIAFKLLYHDTCGITYNKPGGLVEYIRRDRDHDPPSASSLAGRSMLAMGLDIKDYELLRCAARRDK